MNVTKINTALKAAMTEDERTNFINALRDFMPTSSPWYDLGNALQEAKEAE